VNVKNGDVLNDTAPVLTRISAKTRLRASPEATGSLNSRLIRPAFDPAPVSAARSQETA
jgi:hypothetical protein